LQFLDQIYREMGYAGRYDGEIGAGPSIVIISHILLYLLGAAAAIFLIVKRKISFYIPLIAGVIAAIIFWTVVIGIFMSDPNLTNISNQLQSQPLI